MEPALNPDGAGTEAPWWCYFLECADGTLYCGITNDLDKRLAAHNRGTGARYTRGRLPVALVYAETCESRREALRREAALKALSRAAKLDLAATQGEGQVAGVLPTADATATI